jgi:WD40 repeat protein
MKKKYDAFISYSNAADHQLAPSIQSALSKFTKKWFQLNALSIYRDKTNLSPTPHLWTTIREAIDRSEFLILMASKKAAKSEWVEKEVSHWLTISSVKKLIIVLTDGKIVWDAQTHQFEEATNALPPALHNNVFEEEPLYVDFTDITNKEDLSIRNPVFLDKIANIAAPIHDTTVEMLTSLDVKEHKKVIRLRNLAITLLSVLLVLALLVSWIAVNQRQIAEQEKVRAESNFLNSQALLASSNQKHTLALRNAYKSWHTDPENLEPWKTFLNFQYATNTFIVNDTLVQLPVSKIIKNYNTSISQSFLSKNGEFLLEGGHIAISIDEPIATLTNIATLERKQLTLTDDVDSNQLDYDTSFSDDYARFYGSIRKGWEYADDTTMFYEDNIAMEVDASNDGRYFVASSGKKHAMVFDWEGNEVLKLEGHTDRILHATFSNDSKKVATASNDGTIIIHDIETQSRRVLQGNGSANFIYCEFSPDDSRLLAISTDRKIRVWDVRNESTKPTHTYQHKDKISAVRFVSIVAFVVATYDGTIMLYDLIEKQGKVLDESTIALDIDVSTEQHKFVVSSVDGKVKVYNTRGKKRFELLNTSEVGVVKFHPLNPDYVFCGTKNGAINLWHTGYASTEREGEYAFRIYRGYQQENVGRLIYSLQDHEKAIQNISFSNDGSTLISSSQAGVSRIWYLNAIKPLEYSDTRLLPLISANSYNPFTTDSEHVFIPRADSTLIHHRIAENRIDTITGFSDVVRGTVISDNQTYYLAVLNNETFEVKSLNNDSTLVELPVKGDFMPFTMRDQIFTTSESNTITAFDIKGRKLQSYQDQAGKIQYADYNTKKKFVLHANDKNSATLKHLKNDEEHYFDLPANDQDALMDAVLSSDGNYVALLTTSMVHVMDVKTEQSIFSKMLNYASFDDFRPAISFSPDSKRLLVIDSNRDIWLIDFLAQDFNFESAEVGKISKTNFGRFAHDGSMFLTAGDDGIEIYSLEKELLLTINTYEEIHYAWFSPDSKYILAIGKKRSFLFSLDIEDLHQKMNQLRVEEAPSE